MGRGRGKGKRLTAVPSHDDAGSGGEEFLPTYRRRGRPQKPLKDDLDEDVAQKIEQEDGDEMKIETTTKEAKSPIVENVIKRKRRLQIREKSESSNEENGGGPQPKMENLAKSNGFRQNGNRRKSTPRRAAEAGVELMID